MTYKKLLVGLICATATILSSLADEPIILFDFENQPPGGTWATATATQSVTNNGIEYTVLGENRVFGIHRDGDNSEGLAWQNGFIFLFGADFENGTITVSTNGVGAAFQVHSLDIDTASEGNGDVKLTGTLGGIEAWTIIPSGQGDSNTLWITYDTATTGNLSLPIDQIYWESSSASWAERINDLEIQVVEAVFTQLPVYQWSAGGYWTPHSVFPANMSAMGNPLYWWSGYWSTNDPSIIQHRPGLLDLPENGGFHTNQFPSLATDTLVGGLGSRGLFSDEVAPVLETNESLRVTYDTRLYVSGVEDDRIMDVFFTENVATNVANYFGLADGDSWADELGFTLWQRSASNDIAIVFDPSDPNMDIIPPVLTIPLADIGIASPTNGAGGNLLAVTYLTKKTTSPNTWLCSLTISNKDTTAVFSTGDIGVINASAYGDAMHFVIATIGDLSNGDTTSGAGGLGGYEIDDLDVWHLLNPPPGPVGYEAFLVKYGLVAGEEDTGEYEDYDADDLLNIHEYSYYGDPTNGAVPPAILPTMVISNDVAYYTVIQLTDANKGITYSMEATDNLLTGFSVPAWDANYTETVDGNVFIEQVTGELSAGDIQFLRTVVATNAP